MDITATEVLIVHMRKQTVIVGVLVAVIVCPVMAHPAAESPPQVPQVPTEKQCVADAHAWYLDSKNDDKRTVIELEKLLMEMLGCSKYQKQAELFAVSSDLLAGELILRHQDFIERHELTDQFWGKGFLKEEAAHVEQVPTEQQCIADVRAWDAIGGAMNGQKNVRELRRFWLEMGRCHNNPKNRGLFTAYASEASSKLEMYCHDFIASHELLGQFLKEDSAEVQERIGKGIGKIQPSGLPTQAPDMPKCLHYDKSGLFCTEFERPAPPKP